MIHRYALPAAVALVAIGGVAALVAVATGGSEPRVGPPAGDPVVLEASVSPARYAFGDRLLAEVRLTIDRTRVDPTSVVSVPVFRPFRRVGAIRVEESRLGDTTVLRFLYPIQCIDRACVPRGTDQELELQRGVMRYTPRQGEVVTLPFEFPSVTVVSRISPDVQRDIVVQPAALVTDAALEELPPLQPRGGASLLGWLLVGAAAAIVLALGAWLAWRLWPRRPTEEPREVDPEERSLPAALARVERALASDTRERRLVLDELALQLEASSEPILAGEARRLAWSEAGPQRDDTARLAATVVERLNGEASE